MVDPVCKKKKKKNHCQRTTAKKSSRQTNVLSYIIVSVHQCVSLFTGEEPVRVQETDGHHNVLDAGAKLVEKERFK